jgi:cell division protein FtsZ
MRTAQQGLEELRKHVDTIIVIPNQNLFKIANEQTTFKESFRLSNNVLMQGVQSVTDLMVRPGIINLDFADVETVMASMGKAMMGTGEAEGEGRAAKATDMAISNPLIDDYTLRGAKGLLVNITCGDDLKLFEVDEVINKIRAEVDSEAEVITGAITDATLDGKIRVSIVATALDGQQPESKSVINMVHRIQNRNTGYSDFSIAGSAQSFNFSPTIASTITHGANALKLENEVMLEPVNSTTSSEKMNEHTVDNSNIESVVENNHTHDYNQSSKEEVQSNTNEIVENNFVEEEHVSNGLENFGVEGEAAPHLFASDNETIETEGLLSTENTENNYDDDDLEIPAFLRRQKN